MDVALLAFTAAQVMGVSIEKIQGPSRSAHSANQRAILSWILREEGLSRREIAVYINRVDTSALWLANKVDADPELLAKARKIQAQARERALAT